MGGCSAKAHAAGAIATLFVISSRQVFTSVRVNNLLNVRDVRPVATFGV
jgi:hypothetical protein